MRPSSAPVRRRSATRGRPSAASIGGRRCERRDCRRRKFRAAPVAAIRRGCRYTQSTRRRATSADGMRRAGRTSACTAHRRRRAGHTDSRTGPPLPEWMSTQIAFHRSTHPGGHDTASARPPRPAHRPCRRPLPAPARCGQTRAELRDWRRATAVSPSRVHAGVMCRSSTPKYSRELRYLSSCETAISSPAHWPSLMGRTYTLKKPFGFVDTYAILVPSGENTGSV